MERRLSSSSSSSSSSQASYKCGWLEHSDSPLSWPSTQKECTENSTLVTLEPRRKTSLQEDEEETKFPLSSFLCTYTIGHLLLLLLLVSKKRSMMLQKEEKINVDSTLLFALSSFVLSSSCTVGACRQRARRGRRHFYLLGETRRRSGRRKRKECALHLRGRGRKREREEGRGQGREKVREKREGKNHSSMGAEMGEGARDSLSPC